MFNSFEEEAKELYGWLKLSYPNILKEFIQVKKEDPDFLNVPVSPLYAETKKIVDKLVEESGLVFISNPIDPKFKDCLGYYYKGTDLAFKFSELAIEGGHDPILTYWDNMWSHSNYVKEICTNIRGIHYTTSPNKIVKVVAKILKQLKEEDFGIK